MKIVKQAVIRSALAVLIAAAMSLSGAIPAQAAADATISGTVTLEGGAPFPWAYNAYVEACPVGGGDCATAGASHPSGAYTLTVAVPGDYTICIQGGAFTNVISKCWHDGEVVAIAAGQILDIDWAVVIGGDLSGTVSYFSPSLGKLYGANGATVTLYQLDVSDNSFHWYEETHVPPGYPAFRFQAVPPGTYALHFLASTTYQDEVTLNSEYWQSARYWADRTDVVVEASDSIQFGDVVLQPRSFEVSRIAGPNRFEGGVQVSREIYPEGSVPPDGVPVVYIANGLDFPDALTAGPAAAVQDGVVLLVRPTSIPSEVAAELTRLRPQRIVVAGGTAVVSPTVFAQLKSFAPAPENVVRAGGTDRYDTSRKLVSGAFGADGAGTAILAAGASFPDALSAGPAAASLSGPVILVNGGLSSIDSATWQLIQDLGISRIYIAGGTGVVRPEIETSLKILLGEDNVIRVAGSDRFRTAVLISQEFFPASEYAFLATGYNFPDALTGGPLAASYGAPLYLTKTQCLLPEVADDILDLDAQGIVLLGGSAVLTPALEQLKLCG